MKRGRQEQAPDSKPSEADTAPRKQRKLSPDEIKDKRRKKKEKKKQHALVQLSPSPGLIQGQKKKIKASVADIGAYPFEVDYCDHFETDIRALRDIEPLLFFWSRKLGKTKSSVRVYDPYYCQGRVIQNLKQLGLSAENIFHEKRDFYKDIIQGKIPEYDLLITNPPYSEDHKERCLKFCIGSDKPFLLLLPNYIATKNYFQGINTRKNIFFLIPSEKYMYHHPEGTGHGTSPFFSIWYICFGKSSAEAFDWLQKWGQKKSCNWKVKKTMEELVEIKAVPTAKRPSNKRRKKLKQKLEAKQQK